MTTEFEDKYLDVLQNIEWGLLSTTNDNPKLCDHDMLRIVTYVIAYYRSSQRENFLTERKLADTQQEIFERVVAMCEWRLGLRPLLLDKDPCCSPISIQELILCLKRIEKSIKFWTKLGGRNGYINFAATRALV